MVAGQVDDDRAEVRRRAVGVAELTNRTQQLNLQYAEAVVCFVFAGAVYLIVALGGGAVGGRLERRLAIKR